MTSQPGGLAAPSTRAPLGGHVIVVGLGTVGARVLGQLHDLGVAIDNTASRSTSYLAAPEFAAAVLDHQVLRTIAVGRHVLLMAEVDADADADLDGQRIDAVHRPGLLRVIALRSAGTAAVDWSPAPEHVIRGGNRLVVLATRAGLSGLLRRDAASAPVDGVAPQQAPGLATQPTDPAGQRPGIPGK